jgi:hypothetical protein
VDIVSLAIWLIVVVTVCAIVGWLAWKTGFWAKVPEPLQYVVYAVVAIVCILALAHFAGRAGAW